jgi:hypothetical protein
MNRTALIKDFEAKQNEAKQDFIGKLNNSEEFASKVYCFKRYIFAKGWSGNEKNISFGDKYKQIPLKWGIRRNLYVDSGNIYNYGKSIINKYLFKIYINTYDLYDLHDDFGLDEINVKEKIFFYDKINSTFYVEDEHISWFLDTLNEWYLQAKEKAKTAHLENRIEAKKRELERLYAEKERLIEQ